MYILICGGRDWTDLEKIEKEILKLPKSAIIVEGGSRGAERCAAYAARDNEYRVRESVADWDVYGESAGHIRNEQMIKTYSITAALVFHNNLFHSKGETRHMVSLLEREGIPYIVHRT